MEKTGPLFSVHSPKDQEGCNAQTVWNQRCKCCQSQLHTKAKCFFCRQIIKCTFVHFLDCKSRKATRHSDGKNRNKIYAKLLQMFHILFTDNGSTGNGLPLSCVVSDIFTTILLPRNHLRRNTATKLFVTKCTEPYCFVFLYAARCFFSVSEHHS